MRTLPAILFALAAGTSLAAAFVAEPMAAAQTTLGLPTLTYPSATGPWGCYFTRSCPQEPAVTRGES